MLSVRDYRALHDLELTCASPTKNGAHSVAGQPYRHVQENHQKPFAVYDATIHYHPAN